MVSIIEKKEEEFIRLRTKEEISSEDAEGVRELKGEEALEEEIKKALKNMKKRRR